MSRRPGCPAQRGSAGFTLLELLVSLSLLVLIATFLSGSIGFGRRAWEATGKVEETAAVEAVRDYLRRRISQSAPILEEPGSSNIEIAFSGQQDELVFVVDSGDPLTMGGLYAVTIALRKAQETGGEGAVLFARESLYRPGDARQVDDAAIHERDLLDGVEAVAFRYFGRPSFEAESDRWYDSWEDMDRLPKLVSMTVTFKETDQGRRVWPELIVAQKLIAH